MYNYSHNFNGASWSTFSSVDCSEKAESIIRNRNFSMVDGHAFWYPEMEVLQLTTEERPISNNLFKNYYKFF